jgi:hypothetical protein
MRLQQYLWQRSEVRAREQKGKNIQTEKNEGTTLNEDNTD